MKYTVNQAAKIVGATRQTIYRHIESKPISIEKDDNGNQLIDASELIRVYGGKVNFDALNDDESDAVTVKKSQDVTARDNQDGGAIDDKIRLVRLEGEVDKLMGLLRKAEDETAYIKDLLEEEKTERRKASNLLEDMRQKESRGEGWERMLRGLEERLSNQERAAQERAARETELQAALAAEKNKSVWKRLFG